MSTRRMWRTITILAATLAVTSTGAMASADPGIATGDESQSSTEDQLLFFNHAYGVLDRETADAIEHSAYLQEFANFEVRTTTGEQGSWTGRYLYGRETYFELFGEGDLPIEGDSLGFAGLAVSPEHAGDLAKVGERLQSRGHEPIWFRQTRDFGDGEPVPWFDALFVSDQAETFSAWGMEYLPEYFADPRGNTGPPRYPGDVGRDRYLTDDYRDHLMRDVSAIRVGITQPDLDNTVPLLRAGGFVIRRLPNGGITAFRGGTTIRLDVVPRADVGLRRVEMVLNYPVSYRHTEQLGRSTLVVGPGSHAVWTFDRS